MKRKSATQAWKLAVLRSGRIQLPLALREAVFLWEGDAVQATVAQDVDGFYIVFRVLHHGLSREEIDRAGRRAVREVARDRKAGRLIRFQNKISQLDGKLIAEALASGPEKPFRKRDFDRIVTRAIRRAKDKKSRLGNRKMPIAM